MIIEALKSLRPNCSYSVNGDTVDGIKWLSDPSLRPTDAEIITESLRLEEIKTLQMYKMKRMHEYPPMTDFVDAWVKNDETALESYRQKCIAVKEKYPKPEGL